MAQQQPWSHGAAESLGYDADETFFASLAIFDDLDFSKSNDGELNSFKACFISLDSEVVYPPPEPTAFFKRSYPSAQLEDRSSWAKKLRPATVQTRKQGRFLQRFDSEPSLDQMSEESSDSGSERGTSTRAKVSLPNGHSGETRLRINFSTYGTSGPVPQRFGKSGCIIPDGLSGTHEMYDQLWKFEIKHEPHPETTAVIITWIITNLNSGTITMLRETPQQATLREYSGRTMCNKVVKMALTRRAEELEESLKTLKEGAKRQSVENAVRVLRPKLCTVGLLFFGLLHDCVQSRF